MVATCSSQLPLGSLNSSFPPAPFFFLFAVEGSGVSDLVRLPRELLGVSAAFLFLLPFALSAAGLVGLPPIFLQYSSRDSGADALGVY
jgi:hypothetical protein